MYTYKAYVVSIYDGDTIRVNVDLGFGVYNKGNNGKGEPLRLYGINAPEVRGEQRDQGLISRDRLRELILDKDIIIKTIKDSKGKYGRYLANVYLDDVNINEQLVAEGLAVFKEY
tara:strand:+ start:15983 stop:16327 length:345 start_codon:yes stop_codon:yes gene_type:complete